MSQVKMGVLGCGSIAEIAHFPSMAKTDGLVLEAVCDIDEKTAKAAKEKWKAKSIGFGFWRLLHWLIC